MATPGVIRAPDISGSLDAKNIAMQVVRKGIELTDLAAICANVSVPELTATIPVMSIGAGQEDVEELENRPIEGATFTNVAFDLKKDRIPLMVSDEAQYRSKAGDPLTLQVESGGLRLAQIMNKKIVAAMDTTPQTSTGGDWTSTTNPLTDIGTAVAAIRPYIADFIVMSVDVFKAYVSNASTAKFITGFPEKTKGVMTSIPGYELAVYVTSEVDALGAGADGTEAAFVGCGGVPNAVIGQGPIKVRKEDVLDGGTAYQIDIWRQVKSSVCLNDSSLSMGCYKLTDLLT